MKNPKAGEAEPPKDFYFDAVFGPNAEQKNIYDICASGVVESVLNGYNGTIFAYGQVRKRIFVAYHDHLDNRNFLFLSIDWFWKDPHHGRQT